MGTTRTLERATPELARRRHTSRRAIDARAGASREASIARERVDVHRVVVDDVRGGPDAGRAAGSRRDDDGRGRRWRRVEARETGGGYGRDDGCAVVDAGDVDDGAHVGGED